MTRPFFSTRTARILPLCALALACIGANPARADDATLEERMSYKEFTAFGLDKLSPEQLRGLNAWLTAHGIACPPAPSAAAALGPAPAPVAATPDRITSRLAGNFSGWEKGTVLTLENGQKWEVRDDEPVIGSHELHPDVTVEKSLLGWRLSVAGHNEIAHVIPAK